MVEQTPAWRRHAFFLGVFAFFLGAVKHLGLDLPPLPVEAAIRNAQFADLVRTEISVRESAVASAWFPPLPLMLRAPFALLPFPADPQRLGRALACLFSAGTLLQLDRFARARGHRPLLRLGLVLLYALNPLVLAGAAHGSAVAFLAFFTTGALARLLRWRDDRRLGDFLAMSLYLALAAVTTPGGFFFAPVLLGLALFTVRPAGRRAREGLALLGLVPAAYLLFTWAVFNRLLLDDWFYFLRGFGRHLHDAAFAGALAGRALLPALAAVPALCFTLPLAGILLPARRRTGELVSFVLVLAAIVLIALAGEPVGRPIPPSACLPAVPACLLLLAACLPAPGGRFFRGAVAATALLVLTLLPLIPSQVRQLDRETQSRRAAEAAADGLLVALARQPAGSRSIVTGYQGYFLRSRPDAGTGLSHHFLFRPEEVYPVDASTFLLLAEPGALTAGDGVYRDWPGIYRRGAPFTLLEGEVPGWRIFRVIFRLHADRV